MKGLAEEHHVSLVTAASKVEQQQYVLFEAFCESVHLVDRDSVSPASAAKRIASSISGGMPIVVSKNFRKAMAHRIAELTRDQNYDVIHFDHLDSTAYYGYIKKPIRTILDEHNIVTNQVITSEKVEKSVLKKLYMRHQIGPTRRFEQHMSAQVDRCLVCSESDKAHLMAISPSAEISVIPNGVDVDYFGQHQPENLVSRKAKNLIFVGTLDYGPGRVAMEYFFERIWPKLRSVLPDATFTAVGQNPPDFLVQLADTDNRVNVTGRVDDIRPYVQAASVFVVPLLSGSGTRLKILDALAMRIPVVSTTLGAEGLDVQHNESILLADDPDSFCKAIVRVISDKLLAQRLIKNGFELVYRRYSWQSVWSNLLEAYRS